MEPLKIKASRQSPAVYLDNHTGKFEFKGKSRPEDAMLFYDDIHIWLESYLKNPKDETYVKFQLEYFNSSSAKHIKHIMGFFKALADKGYKVNVDWYYLKDDEDMYDVGQEYADLYEVPFNFIAY